MVNIFNFETFLLSYSKNRQMTQNYINAAFLTFSDSQIFRNYQKGADMRS
jgi:hypothetical protein